MDMAEEEGFEPPGRVNAQRFSRPPLSTTQPLLRQAHRHSDSPPQAQFPPLFALG